MRELAATVELRRTQGLAPALTIVETDQGKAYMDDIRNQCAAMRDAADRAVATSSAIAESSVRRLRIVSTAGSLLLLGFSSNLSSFRFHIVKVASLTGPRVNSRLHSSLWNPSCSGELNARRLPEICETRRGCGWITSGVSVGRNHDVDLGSYWFAFSLFGHVAAGHQHGYVNRYVSNRLSDPKHPEPRLQSHAVKVGRTHPRRETGQDRTGTNGISHGSGTGRSSEGISAPPRPSCK
jgi:hypothetical protein